MVNYLVRQIYLERAVWPILYASSLEDLREAPRAINALMAKIVASEDISPVLAKHHAAKDDLLGLFRCLRRAGKPSEISGIYLPVETLVRPETLDFALSHLARCRRPATVAQKEAVAVLRAYFADTDARVLQAEEPAGEGDAQRDLLDFKADSDDASVEAPVVPRSRREPVKWEDVQSLARQAFKVWVPDWEYHWAREAWTILADAGLTSYDEDAVIERAEVYLRMLALGCLYRDFCDLAAGERHYREDWMWVTEVELESEVFHPLVLGMMIGTDGEGLMLNADQLLTDDWHQPIIEPLVDRQRRAVYDALVAGYGSADVLWGMLTLTLEPAPYDWNRPMRHGDPLPNVLIHPSFESLPSWDWLQRGCGVFRESSY